MKKTRTSAVMLCANVDTSEMFFGGHKGASFNPVMRTSMLTADSLYYMKPDI